MAADVTLTGAMQSNLYALQNTNKLLELTQSRLATGRKVQSALDDPIAFFASNEHSRRASDLAGRKDSMGEAVQAVKAASAGIEAITDLINAAKSLAQSAVSSSTSADQASLMSQFQTTVDKMYDIAEDSGYKGDNLMDGSSITIKFNDDGSNTLAVTGFDADDTSSGLKITTTVAAWTTAHTGGASMDSDIAELDSAISILRTEESKLSNNLSIITTRQDFTDNMMNVLQTGAANLVNADMNAEGANMLMLQTRQALGTTSLSIASQGAQAVLRLF